MSYNSVMKHSPLVKSKMRKTPMYYGDGLFYTRDKGDWEPSTDITEDEVRQATPNADRYWLSDWGKIEMAWTLHPFFDTSMFIRQLSDGNYIVAPATWHANFDVPDELERFYDNINKLYSKEEALEILREYDKAVMEFYAKCRFNPEDYQQADGSYVYNGVGRNAKSVRKSVPDSVYESAVNAIADVYGRYGIDISDYGGPMFDIKFLNYVDRMSDDYYASKRKSLKKSQVDMHFDDRGWRAKVGRKTYKLTQAEGDMIEHLCNGNPTSIYDIYNYWQSNYMTVGDAWEFINAVYEYDSDVTVTFSAY